MFMNVNVHRHNYWLQCYDCDAPSRIRGMRSKRETDFHRLLLSATSTRRTVRGTRCPLMFKQHGNCFVPKSWHDFLMEHREQLPHFVCNLFALARHLSVKKILFTTTPSVLQCRKSPSKLNTYLLTPTSGVPLEKLTSLQLVKKFPAFYGTQRFITAFTSARHLSLYWASSTQSKPPYPTSWRSI